jgi:hypothetical protein
MILGFGSLLLLVAGCSSGDGAENVGDQNEATTTTTPPSSYNGYLTCTASVGAWPALALDPTHCKAWEACAQYLGAGKPKVCIDNPAGQLVPAGITVPWQAVPAAVQVPGACTWPATPSNPSQLGCSAPTDHVYGAFPNGLGNYLPSGFHVPPGAGTQNYKCEAVGTGHAWVFTAPSATLYDDLGVARWTHAAGPTWTSTFTEPTANNQKEVVKGTKIASATVSASAIPWLLLSATDTMTAVNYVQRLNTTGGLPPTTGCDASHVGATASVPYTADYLFWALPYDPGTGGCTDGLC